jgi:hypothetical protein
VWRSGAPFASNHIGAHAAVGREDDRAVAHSLAGLDSLGDAALTVHG